MNTTLISSIIVAALGSGGISAIITAILSRHKCESEAAKTESEAAKIKSEADAVVKQTDITGIDYINRKLQEITEQSNKEATELRNRNDELNERINILNDRLQVVMNWIVDDNQHYRQWLETKLIELDPSIEFPKCAPPPKVFNMSNNPNPSK